MGYWSKWYGFVTIIAIVFTFVIGGSFLLVFLLQPKCTAEREGVIYYHGQSGGMDYRCHDGEWQPIK